MHYKVAISCATLAFSLHATALSAATETFSFTGNLFDDADAGIFGFSIASISDVTIRSYSYAGGTQADGTPIPAGGFDPVVALWDGSGALITEVDDSPGDVPLDPVTGSDFDVNFTVSDLSAGNYSVSVVQFSNFALGGNLSNGFSETNPDFTGINYGCSNGQFCDVNGENRTAFWAVDVLANDPGTNPAPVPLPAGGLLLLTTLGGLGLLARRKQTA